MVARGAAVLLLLSLVGQASSAAPEVEDGVYVLTPDNFDGFVKAEAVTLVEFYAPWCGHCKALAPAWAEAAQTLAKDESPIKIAKVDADAHGDLGQRFGVQGFPTIKVFRNGQPSDYNGGRDATSIVNAARKAVPGHTTVGSADEFKAFVKAPGVSKKKVVAILRDPAVGSVSDAFADVARAHKNSADFALWSHGRWQAKANKWESHAATSLVPGAKPPMVVVTEDGTSWTRCPLGGDKAGKLAACVVSGSGLVAL